MTMNEKIAALLVGVWILPLVMGQGRPPASDPAAWNVYSNAKYGYEVRYPDGFEVWPTGPVGERDGRAIRIARKEHSAPAPVLDIQMQVPMPTLKALADVELRDMDVTARDAEINGVPAREVTYRWKINAQAGVHDAHETIWWTIISTFRLHDD
jgi:hypothetical protein